MDIDLNCDLGEGAGHDAELLELVSTANVCCGAHAGSPDIMDATVTQAQLRNVRVGAHPGYHDRENFGRLELSQDVADLYSEIVMQVNALQIVAGHLTHIKPHGAMYHRACDDLTLAGIIVAIAHQFDARVLALPGSQLEQMCNNRVPFIREGFADRRYRADGSLVPRSETNAHIENPDEAVDQAERLMHERDIRSLCVHGDNPRAVEFVGKLRDVLTLRGHRIVPFA